MMVKWLFIMPIICLLDYVRGIFDEDFRSLYLDVEENMLEHMKIEQSKRIGKSLKICLEKIETESGE